MVGLLALLLLAAPRGAGRAGDPQALVGPVRRRGPTPGGIVAALLAIGVQLLLRGGPALPPAVAAARDHRGARPRRAAVSGRGDDRRRRLRPRPCGDARRPPARATAATGTRRRARRSLAALQPQWFPGWPGAAPGGGAARGVQARHANLGAQGGALACVSVASLLVARIGGPTVLGYYALLRVLPWLLGVVISCGLPTASAYFLAGEHGQDRRVRPTLCLMAVVGAGISALVWLACAVPFHAVFFRQMPSRLLVVVMAISVVTWLWNVTAKACCQGSGDIAGANLIIVAEEFWFVPTYPARAAPLRIGRGHPVVGSLIVSGALAP